MSRVTVGFVRLKNTYFELGCYANAIEINDPHMQNKDMGCFYHLVELSGDKLNMSEYFKIAFRFAMSYVSQDTNIFSEQPTNDQLQSRELLHEVHSRRTNCDGAE